MNGTVLDVFKQDAFSVLSLTDAIVNMPFLPGRAGTVTNWAERGVATTSIMLESIDNTLSLINPSPRGGVGTSPGKFKRVVRTLNVPHYQIDDGIMADEVQGVRAFGQENQVQTVNEIVNGRMGEHVQLRMDPTLEYQRVGAIKGVILNGDGSTLYDLFAEFGVSQAAEIDFNLDSTANDGSVRKVCTQVKRAIAKALGGQVVPGIYALCSAEFWDALISNLEVRSTYLNQIEAAQLRGNALYETFNYGGITFEEYRGEVSGSGFIAANKCNIFPFGVPGLFRTVYAPADYLETVNTIGLPRYAKQWPMDNDKGVNLELQMNALSYCTKPLTLYKGKMT